MSNYSTNGKLPTTLPWANSGLIELDHSLATIATNWIIGRISSDEAIRQLDSLQERPPPKSLGAKKPHEFVLARIYVGILVLILTNIIGMEGADSWGTPILRESAIRRFFKMFSVEARGRKTQVEGNVDGWRVELRCEFEEFLSGRIGNDDFTKFCIQLGENENWKLDGMPEFERMRSTVADTARQAECLTAIATVAICQASSASNRQSRDACRNDLVTYISDRFGRELE